MLFRQPVEKEFLQCLCGLNERHDFTFGGFVPSAIKAHRAMPAINIEDKHFGAGKAERQGQRLNRGLLMAWRGFDAISESTQRDNRNLQYALICNIKRAVQPDRTLCGIGDPLIDLAQKASDFIPVSGFLFQLADLD